MGMVTGSSEATAEPRSHRVQSEYVEPGNMAGLDDKEREPRKPLFSSPRSRAVGESSTDTPASVASGGVSSTEVTDRPPPSLAADVPLNTFALFASLSFLQ